jgi:hypothetical protein
MTNQEFLESITLEGEEWRDVIGFEGRYKISSFGRCISLSRVCEDNNRVSKYTAQRLISFTMAANNYLQYRLWKENKEYHRFAHRLVAESFLPNPNNYSEVDHIDTNKTNNHVSNLRWASRSMNQLNPISRKKNSDAKKGKYFGTTKPVVRINPKDPTDIKFYVSASETRRADGFNHTKVCAVCRGERKLHGGYFWMWRHDWEASNQ